MEDKQLTPGQARHRVRILLNQMRSDPKVDHEHEIEGLLELISPKYEDTIKLRRQLADLLSGHR